MDTKTSVDFSDASVLEKIQDKAIESAVEKGVNEATFNRALDKAIETTKTVNQNIKNLDDVFSNEAKDVLKSVAQISTDTKESTANIVTQLSGGGEPASAAASKITIEKIAGDDVINISEKANGFKVSGKALSESKVTVKLGEVTRTITLGENETTWEVNFNLDDTEKSKLSGDYPKTISAIMELNGSEEIEEASLALDASAPKVTINTLGGDGIVSATERDAGLTISGTSDAELGGAVTVLFTRWQQYSRCF